MLTPKQYKLLMFIDNSIKENGCCPSFEEMKPEMSLSVEVGTEWKFFGSRLHVDF